MPAQPPNLPPSKVFPRHAWRDPLLSHLVRLDKVAAEPVRWLSPGRLAAGKLTLLEGDPGLGKSTLLCEFAARVTRGHPLPDGEPSTPRAVLILSAEDDLHDTIRPRIEAAGGDPKLILSLLAAPDGPRGARPLAIPGDLDSIEIIVRHSGAALLIIDPLFAYLSRRHNAHSDQDVRRALLALKTLGEQTGVAVIVVRHLNKSSAANPLYRGGGSIGIIGVARIVWDGPTSWTATDLLQASTTATPSPTTPSALDAARAWLRATLAPGPRPTVEIEHAATRRGITPRTLKQARKAEGILAHKEQKTGGRWYLALPSEESSIDTGDEEVVSFNLPSP